MEFFGCVIFYLKKSEKMADWLGSLKDALSLVADSKAILGGAGGLALISLVGAMPRVGLVRAFTLGWRSYFKTTFPLCVRKSEIQQLNNSILCMKRGSYITVIGGKGNGKSCLIDTTLNRHHGVVEISTESGALKSAIIDQALRAITGIQLDFIKPAGSARRVLFVYSLLFKRPPIVVIRVPERQIGEQYAGLTAAVRALADTFGLRVIVDGSPNSLPAELLTTNRETVIAVEPMSKEQIESIPELEGFINLLKSCNLDGPVWKVLGGSPAKYLKLTEAFELSNTASEEFVDQVKNHLQSVLGEALNKNVAKSSANTKAIVDVFRQKKAIKIPIMELIAMGLLVDYPNKVFREVKTSGRWFVEPATSAVSLIIAGNIQDDDDVYELLEKLFNETKEKVK